MCRANNPVWPRLGLAVRIVDLQGIRDAPRTPGTRNVIPNPTFDVVKAGLVRIVSVR